jgi:hypothetical protein
MQEPTLIGLGYAIEQLLQGRVAPTLSGDVTPEPPRFDCSAATARTASAESHRGHIAAHPRHW